VFKNLIICFLVLLAFGFLSPVSWATILVVDDFDSGLPGNNVGGETDVWSCNPEDSEQFCKMELIDTERVGDAGFCLKLTYDVGISPTVRNGYWSLLNGLDIADYECLSFQVKGDKNTGHTTTFWVELKDPVNTSRVQITGITDEWQKIKISQEKFTNIHDWANLTELMIIFDHTATAKEGVIYIDNIGFEQ